LRTNPGRGGATISAAFGRRRTLEPTVFIVGGGATTTNERLRGAFAATGTHAVVAGPQLAAERACPGDVVVGRLDVRRTLDGVQPGLGRLLQIRDRGIPVVNDADALVSSHDKLATMVVLHAAAIPHPRGLHATGVEVSPPFDAPYVVKPRFGSWGRDVYRCESRADLLACLWALYRRPWFRRHGALVQELIPPRGFDLRLIVSAGTIVGAVERVAAPGEWRTNIALGGSRRPAKLSFEACTLAVRAAAAVGADLVGVDLLPDERGWRVIEINGAVDFTDDYALDGRDVFARAVEPFSHGGAVEILAPAEPVAPLPVEAVSA
jgi:[lysine-biosynthesis-protein LysW]---L-2-aminoadipate ligase